MKRLHGVKKSDLTKIASSSDGYMKKTQQPDILEEELSSHTSPIGGVEFEDIDFDEPWADESDTHKHTPEPEDVHTEDVEEDADEHIDATEIETEDGERMVQSNPKDRSNDIFDRLEDMDPNASSGGRSRRNQSDSQSAHGFRPTSKILQKKNESDVPKSSGSRVTVSIGGKKKDTASKNATSDTEGNGNQDSVKGENSKPKSTGKMKVGNNPKPADKESKSRENKKPDINVETTGQPTDLGMIDEKNSSMDNNRNATGPKPTKKMESTPQQHPMQSTEKASVHIIQVDDSKYTKVLDEFAHVIDKSNQTIENIIEYTQRLADAMAEATQDGSRELLDATKSSLDVLAESTRASIREINETTKKGQSELSKTTSKTLDTLAQKVEEHVSVTTDIHAETSKKLSESALSLVENIKALTQQAKLISQTSDESSKAIVEMAKSTVEQVNATTLELLDRMAKSMEDNARTIQDMNLKNASDHAKYANQMAQNMASITEQGIEKMTSSLQGMAVKIAETIQKTIDDHIKLRNRDQSNQIHMLQQHIISLQQQITNLSRSGALVRNAVNTQTSNDPTVSTSAGTTAAPTAGPINVQVTALPTIPDSFLDPIIDMTEHEVSYDVAKIEKIVRDMADVGKVDETNIYRTSTDKGIDWTPDPKFLQSIRDELVTKHADLFARTWSSTSNVEEVQKVIHETVVAKSTANNLDDKQQHVLEKRLLAQVTGIGKLQPLMDDPNVTEILVVGMDKVFCIVNGRQMLTDIKFESKQEVKELAIDIVSKIGRELTIDNPHCDAKLANGTRVHAIIPPASANGDTIITMRKPPGATRIIGIKEMVAAQALSVDMVEFLKMCVEGKANIILYGETNSGKTTVTRAMANFFGPDERIISLEDTQELNLPNFHYVPLEAVKRSDERKNIGIHELFVDTLRMSPERLIIGEVRGKEGGDMIEAFQSGQRGGITTLHAGSPKHVVTRLVIMMSRAQLGVSESIMRQMIHDSIDIVVQCRRLPDGSRKVTRITELIPLDEAERMGIAPFRDIFKFDQFEIKRDEHGKVTQIVGEHRYKTHLTQEKLMRYFEFGVDIPQKFGTINMD